MINLQSLLSCLPEWFRSYAALHMDTVAKLINHLLIFMAGCNFILFLASWHVSMLPDMGLNTPMISFLLCCQNVCLWCIFNNAHYPNLNSLAPTEFMVGNSLGVTIGATLLAMVLSNYFRNLSKCDSSLRGTVPEYICAEGKRTLGTVAFWSGLVFWLEFCLALLIAMGRRDLISRSNYHDLSVDDEDFRRHAEQQPAGNSSVIGTFASALPTPSFGGNYTSVPEINNASSGINSAGTTVTPLGNV